jgi:hypothetical protein
MRRKQVSRKHEVWAAIDNIELVRAKSSLHLNVWADGEKIGQLEIGQGSLFWWGKNRHKSKRLNWSLFAKKMDELAYEDE